MGIFPTRKPDGHHVADTPASEVYLNLNEPDYDAKMRAAWERTMPENLREADDYRHVAVLIAQWADDLDQDLGCAAEVQELQGVFINRFGFQCSRVVLDTKTKPQAQLSHALARFVLDNDGPCRSNLLIVYYTGHGVGRDDGSLTVHGTLSPEHARSQKMHKPVADWSKASGVLDDADADVLAVLDCCCAGSIMKGATEHTRSFEVLAATGINRTTARPGPRSFTRAFIDSLTMFSRRDDSAFNTFDLNADIMQRRRDMSSHIFPRYRARDGRHIKLAPLVFDDSSTGEVTRHNIHDVNTAYLDLRFTFNEVLDKPALSTFAKTLSDAVKRPQTFGYVRSIEWLGIRTRYSWPAVVHQLLCAKRVVRRWRSRRRLSLDRTMHLHNVSCGEPRPPAWMDDQRSRWTYCAPLLAWQYGRRWAERVASRKEAEYSQPFSEGGENLVLARMFFDRWRNIARSKRLRQDSLLTHDRCGRMACDTSTPSDEGYCSGRSSILMNGDRYDGDDCSSEVESTTVSDFSHMDRVSVQSEEVIGLHEMECRKVQAHVRSTTPSAQIDLRRERGTAGHSNLAYVKCTKDDCQLPYHVEQPGKASPTGLHREKKPESQPANGFREKQHSKPEQENLSARVNPVVVDAALYTTTTGKTDYRCNGKRQAKSQPPNPRRKLQRTYNAANSSNEQKDDSEGLGDSDDDIGPGPARGRMPTKFDLTDERRWACYYHQRDPLLFNGIKHKRFKTCGSQGWSCSRDLDQHLMRCHMLPACYKCGGVQTLSATTDQPVAPSSFARYSDTVRLAQVEQVCLRTMEDVRLMREMITQLATQSYQSPSVVVKGPISQGATSSRTETGSGTQLYSLMEAVRSGGAGRATIPSTPDPSGRILQQTRMQASVNMPYLSNDSAVAYQGGMDRLSEGPYFRQSPGAQRPQINPEYNRVPQSLQDPGNIPSLINVPSFTHFRDHVGDASSVFEHSFDDGVSDDWSQFLTDPASNAHFDDAFDANGCDADQTRRWPPFGAADDWGGPPGWS